MTDSEQESDFLPLMLATSDTKTNNNACWQCPIKIRFKWFSVNNPQFLCQITSESLLGIHNT